MTASAPDYAAYTTDVLEKQWIRRSWPRILAIDKPADERPAPTPKLLEGFYAAHICRFPPIPSPRPAASKHLNAADLHADAGPGEFGPPGRLEKWDRKADLPRIAVPTLVVGARHDTMDPDHMRLDR